MKMSLIKSLGIALLVLASCPLPAMRAARRLHPSVYALQVAGVAELHSRAHPAPTRQLPVAAYKACTRVIEEATYATGKSFPHDWKKYCATRVSNLEKLQRNAIKPDHALAGLDSRDIKIRNFNLLETANCVAFAYAFAHRSEQLLSWRVKLEVGAYVEKLEDFEKGYIPPLEKISTEEYKKRIKEKIDNERFDSLHIEESARLAQYMLANAVEAKL